MPSSGVPERHPRQAIVMVSGGLDSAVLAYWLAARGVELTLLSFDHGQRHRIELVHAADVASALGCPHEIVDLSALGPLQTGPVLTDPDVPASDRHHHDDSMRVVTAPNRSATMLDIAAAVAAVRKVDTVALGVRAGDHTGYPVCRPEVVDRFVHSVRIDNKGLPVDGPEILTPLLMLTKADIVRIGVGLGVPFDRTWSCYCGENQHCGACGACAERMKAFQHNGIADPTTYRTANGGDLS